MTSCTAACYPGARSAPPAWLHAVGQGDRHTRTRTVACAHGFVQNVLRRRTDANADTPQAPVRRDGDRHARSHADTHAGTRRHCVTQARYTYGYSHVVTHTKPHTTPLPWVHTASRAGCPQHGGGPSCTCVPFPPPAGEAQEPPTAPGSAVASRSPPSASSCSQQPGVGRAVGWA